MALHRTRFTSGVSLLLLAVACAAPDEQVGQRERESGDTGEVQGVPDELWTLPGRTMAEPIEQVRVELRVNAGGASIISASRVYGPPAVPAMDPDYLVSLRAGPRLLAAVPVSIPWAGIADVAGRGAVQVYPVGSVVSVFLPAVDGFDRVAVEDRAGAELDAVLAGAIPAGSPPPPDGLAEFFPLVRLLAPGDAGQLSGLDDYLDGDLVEPTDEMIDDFVAAMAFLGPAGPNGIHTLGFGRLIQEEAGLVTDGWTTQGTVLYNTEMWASYPADLRLSILAHEAAHAYNFLVDGGATGTTDGWSSEAVAAMAAATSAWPLAIGVTSTWATLHQSAVGADQAGTYTGEIWERMSDGEAWDLGFASAYGSSDSWEDFAEFGANIPFGESAYCAWLSAQVLEDNPGARIALAKALYLDGLGLSWPHKTEECLGQLLSQLGSEPGIHLGSQVDLTGNVKAGTLDDAGKHYHVISGSSGAWSGALYLLAPENNSVGLHRLDSFTIAESEQGGFQGNAFYLSNDEDYSLARASSDGLVLVARGDAEAYRGAMFYLTLNNGMWETETIPIVKFSWTP